MAVYAACAYLLLSMLGVCDSPFLALLLYNGIVFALQAPLGWLIDKWFHPKPAAMMGLICVAGSFLFVGNLPYVLPKKHNYELRDSFFQRPVGNHSH